MDASSVEIPSKPNQAAPEIDARRKWHLRTQDKEKEHVEQGERKQGKLTAEAQDLPSGIDEYHSLQHGREKDGFIADPFVWGHEN